MAVFESSDTLTWSAATIENQRCPLLLTLLLLRNVVGEALSLHQTSHRSRWTKLALMHSTTQPGDASG